MPLGPPRRRRARPVADAPIDALLLRVEDLTKGWLLALLEDAPLDDAAAILATDLARDGPRVCDAVLRAVGSDEDLRRLEPGGELEPVVSRSGTFGGAGGVEAASRAVDALHDVIWSGLLEELHRPDPEQVTELAERLSLVVERVRGAALRGDAGEPRVSRMRSEAEPNVPDPVREPVRAVREAERAVREAERTPDPLWLGAVHDEVDRAQRTGASLSLLLVELEDAHRVAAIEPEHDADAAFGRFAQAVRSSLRRQDILACETDSRAWVIARDTGRAGGHALASRIASGVRAAPAWRGAPMTVSVGVAVLREDGRDHTSLIEAAEESMFAAASSGVTVVPGGRSDEGEEPGGTD